MTNPDSRDGLNHADPYHMIDDEITKSDKDLIEIIESICNLNGTSAIQKIERIKQRIKEYKE